MMFFLTFFFRVGFLPPYALPLGFTPLLVGCCMALFNPFLARNGSAFPPPPATMNAFAPAIIASPSLQPESWRLLSPLSIHLQRSPHLPFQLRNLLSCATLPRVFCVPSLRPMKRKN
uniref:Putative secreted protein n=1 Tax=Panstrongylus lignarius TaxID=156445 RepID=A0A224Y231_9HEMI